MSVTQTVEIPASHRLTIDVPREVPAGPVILTFTPATDRKSKDQGSAVAADDGLDYEGECPLCAAKNYMPNAETIAAIEEGRAMMRGEIPAKWYTSTDEMFEDLDRDDPDD
jgi:hypothetical protein